MTISVIIPTRNREMSLKRALDSILSLGVPNSSYEILVIDNGSTDETKKVILSFVDKMENLKYINEPKLGLHNARHTGLLKSSNECLAFVDDDIVASSSWMKGILKTFSEANADMVGGNCLPKTDIECPSWINELWELSSNGIYKSLGALSIFEVLKPIEKLNPFLVYGCNFSIRKKVLLDAGGFHPDGVPPSSIFFRGDGETYVSSYVKNNDLKCIFSPEATIYHCIPNSRLSIDYFIERAYRQGISNSFRDLRREGFEKSLFSRTNSIIKKSLRPIKRYFYLKKFSPKTRNYIDHCYREVDRGYFDHLKKYKSSKNIRNWVHQENFYNSEIPLI